jgi:cell wall-associated NlpC family hydrolase
VASRGGDARSKMADYSLKFQGTPYVWGGNDELNGIDCSGFVKKMYGKIGLSLPRTAAEQALVGKPIYNLEDLQKGDRLYFWDKKRGKIGHTGIYLGDGNFVHSSSGRGGVATDYLGSDRWLKILVAARR